MDQLRAKAFIEPLLGTDSRPQATETAESRTPAPGGPLVGVIPPGFVGRVTLTIPAATLLDLAD